MNSKDIDSAAINIAGRLKVEIKAKRVAKVTTQHIRCAVVGYLVGHNIDVGFSTSDEQVCDLLNRTVHELLGMPS